MLFLWLKFLHVLTAMIWVGGLVVLAVFNFRLSRTRERPFVLALARQSQFLGTRVLGPASGLTLLSGIIVMAVGHVGMTLWVIWGFVAFLLSAALGATLLRRAAGELGHRLEAGDDDRAVAAVQRRLAGLHLVNLVLLASAAGAMVIKPTI